MVTSRSFAATQRSVYGIESAHGANECVYVDDLVTQAKVYVETITRLLGAA